MKSAVIEKVQRQVSNNFADYTYEEELLEDYFDDAYNIIRSWRKLTKDDEFLTGKYDSNIKRFIIESLNIAGLEGQYSSSANGIQKIFIATPETNLKCSIPQVL